VRNPAAVDPSQLTPQERIDLFGGTKDDPLLSTPEAQNFVTKKGYSATQLKIVSQLRSMTDEQLAAEEAKRSNANRKAPTTFRDVIRQGLLTERQSMGYTGGLTNTPQEVADVSRVGLSVPTATGGVESGSVGPDDLVGDGLLRGDERDASGSGLPTDGLTGAPAPSDDAVAPDAAANASDVQVGEPTTWWTSLTTWLRGAGLLTDDDNLDHVGDGSQLTEKDLAKVTGIMGDQDPVKLANAVREISASYAQPAAEPAAQPAKKNGRSRRDLIGFQTTEPTTTQPGAPKAEFVETVAKELTHRQTGAETGASQVFRVIAADPALAERIYDGNLTKEETTEIAKRLGWKDTKSSRDKVHMAVKRVRSKLAVVKDALKAKNLLTRKVEAADEAQAGLAPEDQVTALDSAEIAEKQDMEVVDSPNTGSGTEATRGLVHKLYTAQERGHLAAYVKTLFNDQLDKAAEVVNKQGWLTDEVQDAFAEAVARNMNRNAESVVISDAKAARQATEANKKSLTKHGQESLPAGARGVERDMAAERKVEAAERVDEEANFTTSSPLATEAARMWDTWREGDENILPASKLDKEGAHRWMLAYSEWASAKIDDDTIEADQLEISNEARKRQQKSLTSQKTANAGKLEGPAGRDTGDQGALPSPEPRASKQTDRRALPAGLSGVQVDATEYAIVDGKLASGMVRRPAKQAIESITKNMAALKDLITCLGAH
jgi:hypothetical protein